MAVDDIQIKLNTLLTRPEDLGNEIEVLYLMAELRKLIEHEPGELKPEYRNIKFYCDWALHTAKTRSFVGLETTFKVIYDDCANHIQHESTVVSAPKLIEFLYFEGLSDHMRVLFERHGLPTDMLDDEEKWVDFVKGLLQILTDQPVMNIPESKISKICVIGANSTGAAIRVYFHVPIVDEKGQERSYYQLSNGF